jgi:invasion protein IalB
MIFKSNFTKKAALSAFAGAFAVAAMPAASFAQQASGAGRPPQGWFKVCTKQEDNDVCIVQNLLTASNGQLVTAVGLISVQGQGQPQGSAGFGSLRTPHPGGYPDADRWRQGHQARLRHLHAG